MGTKFAIKRDKLGVVCALMYIRYDGNPNRHYFYSVVICRWVFIICFNVNFFRQHTIGSTKINEDNQSAMALAIG